MGEVKQDPVITAAVPTAAPTTAVPTTAPAHCYLNPYTSSCQDTPVTPMPTTISPTQTKSVSSPRVMVTATQGPSATNDRQVAASATVAGSLRLPPRGNISGDYGEWRFGQWTRFNRVSFIAQAPGSVKIAQEIEPIDLGPSCKMKMPHNSPPAGGLD